MLTAELNKTRRIGCEYEMTIPLIGTGSGHDVQQTLANVLTANGIRAIARPYDHTLLPRNTDVAVEYDSSVRGESQYAGITWTLFFCNTIVPQILWIRPLRRKESVLVIVSLLVLAGMWLERYMIITTSLSRDYLPSSWGFFQPTIWDIATYAGSVGVFLVAFLLFARFLPILSMSETRALLPGAHGPEVGR